MDFSAVCRTCLSTEGLSPIFVLNMDYKRHSTAVYIATGIKIDINDGFPQQMCRACTSYVNGSIQFRKQCRDSEKKLIQLKQSYDTTNVSEILTKKENCETLDNLKYEYDFLKTELKCENADEMETDKSADEMETVKSADEIEAVKSADEIEAVKSADEIEAVKSADEIETVKSADEIETVKSAIEMEIVKSADENNTSLSLIEKKDDEGIRDKIDKIESMKENRLCKKKSKVQRVSCPICQKDLSARSLRAHVTARHGAGAGLRCGYCKLEHSSKDALAAHTAKCPMKRTRVSESGREMVSCDVCHISLQRNSLRAHQAVKHKGLGPVCEHCGRRFGNKLRLSEHLRAKHGYAKLQCSRCEFKSASNTALQNHERRHRGEKPYVCEKCGAKFHAAYLLAQHRRAHSAEKRVKCGQCGATFKSSNNLHAHRAARHGARRHRCLLCTRVYSCRQYAVKHLRAVHGFKGTVPALQVDPAPTSNSNLKVLIVN